MSDDVDPAIFALAERIKAELGPEGFAAFLALLRSGAIDAIESGLARETEVAASASAAPTPDLADELAVLFDPLLAKADEKAELLLDALAAAGHAVDHIPAKGFRPTIARLQRTLSDDTIRAGAEAAMAAVRAFGSLRETVR